jgi:hypothetical protein
MPRRPYHPLALLVGVLALPLCLVRPVFADPSAGPPSDADIVVPASAHAAEASSQRNLLATTGTWFTTGFDIRDFDVELFEAGLPRDVPAPAGHDLAAVALAATSSDEDKPLMELAAKFHTWDFTAELFEASLPRDIPAPAGKDAAAATLATASPDEGKPQLKSAADHLRNKPPAAMQPLRSSMARGKTNKAARTALPAARKVAAAPPAITPRARPRAAMPGHGPRELFIGRVPPSDRDEVMPALRLIPVMRVWLPPPPPPPSLALK